MKNSVQFKQECTNVMMRCDSSVTLNVWKPAFQAATRYKNTEENKPSYEKKIKSCIEIIL